MPGDRKSVLRQQWRVIAPAFLRMLIICVAAWSAGLLGYAQLGLWTAAIGFAVLLLFHLFFLGHLGAWLERPSLETLPDGTGAWAEVFARLYRARRASERNERRLLDNEERFRLTISALPEGIVLIDAAFQIEWCNPVAERHLGIILAGDGGLRLTNLVRDPEFVAYMTSGAFEHPLVFRPLANPQHVLSVLLIPFESTRSIVITRDVTQRERVDQIRRDFVANVSHEMRTPLTVVSGFLEILAEAQPPLDPLRLRHVGLMQEQAQRMQRLIEDLLMLSRLESSERSAEEDVIDVSQLISEVADEARALSNGRHTISVTCEVGTIRGIRDELRSAFGNLVSNAIRYTPTGGSIALRWKIENESGTFEVEDTGIGVAAEHVPRLTERFYRVDKSRSRETGGTGLGLAIVKHVVIRHGGTLDIRSQLGAGSTFSVRLPRGMQIDVGFSTIPRRAA